MSFRAKNITLSFSRMFGGSGSPCHSASKCSGTDVTVTFITCPINSQLFVSISFQKTCKNTDEINTEHRQKPSHGHRREAGSALMCFVPPLPPVSPCHDLERAGMSSGKVNGLLVSGSPLQVKILSEPSSFFGLNIVGTI